MFFSYIFCFNHTMIIILITIYFIVDRANLGIYCQGNVVLQLILRYFMAQTHLKRMKITISIIIIDVPAKHWYA